MINKEEQAYLDLMKKILNEGSDREDRTGVGTFSLFGEMLRFDLSKGFPLLTTKKVHLKSIIHELLWFLKGDTNVKYLNDQNIHIWDEWADKDGNLGPIYGRQWVAWEKVDFMPKQTFVKPNKVNIELVNPMINPEPFIHNKLNHNNIYKSLHYGDFRIIKQHSINRKRSIKYTFDIQFIDTGFIKKNVAEALILLKKIKDPFCRSLFGVACIGDIQNIRSNRKLFDMLYQTWFAMIRRCYETNHSAYGKYGKRGIFVDDRWLIFSNFYHDVQNIENWFNKLEFPNEYSLDKDYYCSNKYSKDTCIWANKSEQSVNYGYRKAFKLTDPNGYETIEFSVNRAAKKYGLTTPALQDVLNGKCKQAKKWTAEYVETDLVPRIRIFNQVHNLIANLKHDPYSRRLILGAWNVGELPRMALPPCHVMTTFHVDNNKLSCLLYQRSADFFLGAPFNIASYSLLTMMLAQITGLQVGELIISFGDVHIYKNHIDQCKEQLSRTPYLFPKMILDSNVKSIFDFRYHNFTLIDYNPQPSIKAPIAV